MAKKIENNIVLTAFGEKFIKYVCGISLDGNNPKNKPEDDNLLRGNAGPMPSSDDGSGNLVDKEWFANIKNNKGEIIKTNEELAPLLIEWFNKWGKEYNLDPNILAAQAYIESGYRMWVYNKVSTASGLNQFTMDTVYSVIVNNFSTVTPQISTSEIHKITLNLENALQKSSYFPQGNQSTIIARKNRPILHQNIIDNPKIMIKAQARYMKYFSNESNKLASTSLFCYNRGSKYIAATYTESIEKAKKDKGEEYIPEGLNYVLKIFGVLGDKNNNLIPIKNYKPQKEWFGYDQLKLGVPFDAYNANVAESEVYGITGLDDLTIVNDPKYRFIYFPEEQYIRSDAPVKTQIVLHHTVSGGGNENDDGIEGDVSWWRTKGERVATSFIIARDGRIYQLFSTDYWAYHLGIESDDIVYENIGLKPNNFNLNQQSIGIEIDSWGGLISSGGRWYPAAMDDDGDFQKIVLKPGATPINADKVYEYNKGNNYPKGFRDFYAFEKYTEEQITSVQKLILSLVQKFPDIDLTYQPSIWDINYNNAGESIGSANGAKGISYNALAGDSGIWTHVSYRADKSDCHPQPELIKMLRNLENLNNFDDSFKNNSKLRRRRNKN